MKDRESTYTIHVEGEVILVTPIGSQSPAAIRSIRQEVETLLGDKHGPKDVLIDNSRADPPDKEGMEVALASLREVPYRRMAVFGANPDMLLVARTLVERSGMEGPKIFRDEAMARAWLKESSHPVRARLEQKKDRILHRHDED